MSEGLKIASGFAVTDEGAITGASLSVKSGSIHAGDIMSTSLSATNGITISSVGLKVSSGFTVTDTGVVTALGAMTGASLNVGSGAITSGAINGQTISSAASLTGTLAVASGVTVAAGGLKVTAGGLQVASGLTVTDAGAITSGSKLVLIKNANAELEVLVKNLNTGSNAFSQLELQNSVGSAFIRLNSNGNSDNGGSNSLNIMNPAGGKIIIRGSSNGVELGSSGTAFSSFSDLRLKRDVSMIETSLDKINGIRGVYFNYIHDEPTSRRRVGVIAQDLLNSVPEAVDEDEITGMYQVRINLVVTIIIQYLYF